MNQFHNAFLVEKYEYLFPFFNSTFWMWFGSLFSFSFTWNKWSKMENAFPRKQVVGFALSIILTLIAVSVYFLHVSFPVVMTILLVTAFIQAGLQLVVFMHASETKDKGAIFTNIYYALIIALVTVFGTILCMVWGYL